MNRGVALGLFSSIIEYFFDTSSNQESDWQSDPVESKVGIHILYDMGGEHRHWSERASIEEALSAIRSIRWEREFAQIIAVTEPGISMDVGGSLDDEHGLSAMHVNRHQRRNALIVPPPESVGEMEDIMRVFLVSDEAIFDKYRFDFGSY